MQFLFLIGGFLKKSSPLKQLYQMKANQKQEWHVVAMFVNGSGQNDHSL
jgi:hypothetical protein